MKKYYSYFGIFFIILSLFVYPCKCGVFDERLFNSLDEKQKILYKNYCEETSNIHSHSIIFSVIVTSYYFFTIDLNKIKHITIILFFITMKEMFYFTYKKKYYSDDFLDTEEKKDLWKINDKIIIKKYILSTLYLYIGYSLIFFILDQ